MKQDLVFEKISYTKLEPLAATEAAAMKSKIFKRVKIYVPGYLVITACGLYMLLRGPQSLNDFRRTNQIHLTEDSRALFWQVAPYFAAFLLLITTVFLLLYYLRSVRPLVSDIRNGKKMVVYYKPKKMAMPLFNRYYITIPLYSNQQIEITRGDFEAINENDLLCLEMAPASQFLFSLKNGEMSIGFDDPSL